MSETPFREPGRHTPAKGVHVSLGGPNWVFPTMTLFLRCCSVCLRLSDLALLAWAELTKPDFNNCSCNDNFCLLITLLSKIDCRVLLSRAQIKLVQLHIDKFERRQDGGKNLIGMHCAGFA